MSTRKDLIGVLRARPEPIEVRPSRLGRVRLDHVDGRRFTIRQWKNHVEIRERNADGTVTVYFAHPNIYGDGFAQQLGLALS